MRVRVVLELLPTFDEQAAQLVSDLSDAAAEGQHELEELLSSLPSRLRRIYHHNVRPKPNAEDIEAIRKLLRDARATPDAGTGHSVVVRSSAADGSPVAPRSGRPHGTAKSVYPRLTSARRDRGLSRDDVAARAADHGCWISRSTIGRIESGETLPERHHAEAFAAALELPLDEVLAMLELAAGHVVAI